MRDSCDQSVDEGIRDISKVRFLFNRMFHWLKKAKCFGSENNYLGNRESYFEIKLICDVMLREQTVQNYESQ